jgi:hypothetical protein
VEISGPEHDQIEHITISDKELSPSEAEEYIHQSKVE